MTNPLLIVQVSLTKMILDFHCLCLDEIHVFANADFDVAFHHSFYI